VLLSGGVGGWRETQRFVSLFTGTLVISEKKVFVRSQQKMFRSKDGSTHKSHDVTFNPTNKQWIFGGRALVSKPSVYAKVCRFLHTVVQGTSVYRHRHHTSETLTRFSDGISISRWIGLQPTVVSAALVYQNYANASEIVCSTNLSIRRLVSNGERQGKDDLLSSVMKCIHLSFTYSTCITQNEGYQRSCRSKLTNRQNTSGDAFASSENCIRLGSSGQTEGPP
jgi:hypothetical protein